MVARLVLPSRKQLVSALLAFVGQGFGDLERVGLVQRTVQGRVCKM